MQTLTRFNHERQQFIMTDPRPPASPFEWRRYCEEEAIRRGEKPAVAPPKKVGRPYKRKENQTKDPR